MMHHHHHHLSRLLAVVVWTWTAVLLAEGLKVTVIGATGRVGRLVTEELVRREEVSRILAVVRDEAKAAEVLPVDEDRVTICSKVKLTDRGAVEEVCGDADAVVWTASGLTEGGSAFSRMSALLGTVLRKPGSSFDAKALATVGDVVQSAGKGRIICCSSAAASRPAWNDDKKTKYEGAADIPIVRLNDKLKLLDVKAAGEDALRSHAPDHYTIVRPTGLNDDWPRGRVVLSQGDLAVGRTNRADLAQLLVDLALKNNTLATGRTFECFTLAGYPSARDLDPILARLLPDDGSSPTDPASSADPLDLTYAILQQLVPGETLAPNQLAMGQTYENLDNNQTGRLGERGAEQLPTFVEASSS